MSMSILAILAVVLLGALLRQVMRRRAHAAVLRQRLESIRRERRQDLAEAQQRQGLGLEWEAQWFA